MAKVLHFNVPQVKTMLIDATETYAVMSRGIGKSSGIGAPWLIKRASEMPRSQGGILGATFQQLLTRTLPPVIASWQRMGYEQNVHYVIGREPSKRWKRMHNWQGPRNKPLDSKYAIYWFDGSCQVLISQDRVGSSNGLSLAYFYNDEAKLTNRPRMEDELIPTLRGDRSHYGTNPQYGGMLFTTDMPTSADARWILDKAEEMDVDQMELILKNQLYYNHLYKHFLNASSQAQKEKLKKHLKQVSNRLWRLRIGGKSPDDPNRRVSVHYHEANIYDNLDVLGDNYIRRMRKSMSDLKYRTSILNERLTQIEGGFYPRFDPAHHGTDWSNFGYLDHFLKDSNGKTSAPPEDCRKDSGHNPSQPLEIALDYGKFNCLVVGQQVGKEYRLLNAFHRNTPHLVQDAVKDFCNYFKYTDRRVVKYYYDHTAIAGYANTQFTYMQSVINTLRDEGWHVIPTYVGKAPDHTRKYEIINKLFAEDESSLPLIRFSRNNMPEWEVSMCNAPAKEGRRGIEKDKRSERDEDLPQKEATHYSDASDTLLFFSAAERINNGSAGSVGVFNM